MTGRVQHISNVILIHCETESQEHAVRCLARRRILPPQHSTDHSLCNNPAMGSYFFFCSIRLVESSPRRLVSL